MTVTLAEAYPQFLDDLAHNHQLRLNTLRAYRYELAAAAADARFLKLLPELAISETHLETPQRSAYQHP